MGDSDFVKDFTKEADFYTVTIDCGTSNKMDEAIEIAKHYAKKYSCVVTVNAHNRDGTSIGRCICLPNGGIWG